MPFKIYVTETHSFWVLELLVDKYRLLASFFFPFDHILGSQPVISKAWVNE